MATFPGTIYIYSIIFRLDPVANRIKWLESGGPRWPLYPKCPVYIYIFVFICIYLYIDICHHLYMCVPTFNYVHKL